MPGAIARDIAAFEVLVGQECLHVGRGVHAIKTIWQEGLIYVGEDVREVEVESCARDMLGRIEGEPIGEQIDGEDLPVEQGVVLLVPLYVGYDIHAIVCQVVVHVGAVIVVPATRHDN